MLPFFAKARRNAGMISHQVGKKSTDMKDEMPMGSDEHTVALHETAKQMLSAIEAKSPADLAKAHKQAFDLHMSKHKDTDNK